jgi:hypothetical protein
MALFVLFMTGVAFIGFIVGLAGKSRAITRNSIKKSIFYQNLTVVSLILMIVFSILYSLLN